MNYAIPDDGAVPSRDDVAALCAVFAARGRQPRLEYLPDAAPEVERVLFAAGFTAEGRYPVMTCDAVRDCSPPQGIEVRAATTSLDFLAASGAQAEAYGNGAPRPEVLGDIVARGGVAALAEDLRYRVTVGVGSCMAPVEGVSELGGIGVISAYRKRGIAAALTARLARAILDRGATLVWLTPGHDEAGRVYARAGFAKACEALHIGRV